MSRKIDLVPETSTNEITKALFGEIQELEKKFDQSDHDMSECFLLNNIHILSKYLNERFPSVH